MALGDENGFGPLSPLLAARTYKRFGYLLLSFPLGLAYFVFLAVGLSLGAGLAIIGIGIPILLGTLLGLRVIAKVERLRCRLLLDRPIDPPPKDDLPDGLLDRTRAIVSSETTWSAAGYIVFIFAFGVAGFAIALTVLVTGISLVTAPLTYNTTLVGLQFGPWEPTTLLEASLLVPFGFLVLVVGSKICMQLGEFGGERAVRLLGPRDRE